MNRISVITEKIAFEPFTYDRVPHLNYWVGRHAGNPRFPRRKQWKVRTTRGNYTIDPSQDGVVLMFNGRIRFNGFATEKPVCVSRVEPQPTQVK